MRTTRLQVTLREVKPPVVRVIDVPADLRLDKVHAILQVAIGWTNSHLHEFVVGEQRYGFADAEAEPDELDETTVRLSDLPAGFIYVYDFGDTWVHDVEQQGAGGDRPGCVDGTGACPPEDCGGPAGYAELLAALADTRHPGHDELTAWTGNRLVPFDRATTDTRVRHAVGNRRDAAPS